MNLKLHYKVHVYPVCLRCGIRMYTPLFQASFPNIDWPIAIRHSTCTFSRLFSGTFVLSHFKKLTILRLSLNIPPAEYRLYMLISRL
jgi:hypothetical protein